MIGYSELSYSIQRSIVGLITRYTSDDDYMLCYTPIAGEHLGCRKYCLNMGIQNDVEVDEDGGMADKHKLPRIDKAYFLDAG